MPDTIRVDRGELIDAYQSNSPLSYRRYRVGVYKDGHTEIFDCDNPETSEIVLMKSSEIEQIRPERFIIDKTGGVIIPEDHDGDLYAYWNEQIELIREMTLESGDEGETRTVRVEVIDENE